MINLMYLVLTALLALNVSKSILNAFVRVNQSLEVTTENFMRKNNVLYSDFKETYMADRKKAADYWNRAKEVRERADTLFNHIRDMKTYLKKHTQGVPWDTAEKIGLGEMSGLSNKNVPTQKLGLSTPLDPKGPEWGNYTARGLEMRIDSFRNFLTRSLVELTDMDTGKISLGLQTKGQPEADDPAAESWGGLHFYQAPVAAAITALTKIQSDVRNAESDVVSELKGQIGASDFKFDTLAPKVVPNSDYIAVGDTYRADVVVAAWNSTRQPELRVGQDLDTAGNLKGEIDSANITYDNGIATYTVVPEKKGEIKWGGEIAIQGPSGNMKSYPIRVNGEAPKFRAAEQSAVVSPTKMNVLYIGVKNPVSVSVPGVAAADLGISVIGGGGSAIPRGQGDFHVKVSSGNSCKIQVRNKKSNQTYGSKKFRVKTVPPPKPYLMDKSISDSKIKATKLRNAGRLRAEMENFEFDLDYNVTEFTMTAIVAGQPVRNKQKNGATLTNDMKKVLKRVKSGQKVYFENIKAVGPDGEKKLGGLSLKAI